MPSKMSLTRSKNMRGPAYLAPASCILIKVPLTTTEDLSRLVSSDGKCALQIRDGTIMRQSVVMEIPESILG